MFLLYTDIVGNDRAVSVTYYRLQSMISSPVFQLGTAFLYGTDYPWPLKFVSSSAMPYNARTLFGTLFSQRGDYLANFWVVDRKWWSSVDARCFAKGGGT